MRAVRDAGLTRYLGFTGLGDPEALLALANTGLFDSVQAYFNVINPSAGHPVKPDFPGQDFGLLIDKAAEKRMGILAIRVMAAGAITGSSERHPIAATNSGDLTPGTTYETDLADARKIVQAIEPSGLRSTAELAVRFALSKPEVSTVLVGFSDTEQLEEAVRWANAGPLSPDVFRRLAEVGNLAYSY
jgi:aryl-alcohol dehydrogenase-like predicted oxidoreductase